VASETVQRIDYDEPSRTLFVRFVAGGLYAYFEVAPEVVVAFRKARSKGAFFNKKIRHGYASHPVHVDAPGVEEEPAPAAPKPKPRKAAPAEGVELRQPDKRLWPDVTKADLAAYYQEAAEWILPYVRGRPCTVVLGPDGIGGELFFQRHARQRKAGLADNPHVTLVPWAEKGKTYLQFDTPDALAAVAQSAGLELHPWNSVEGDPGTPGRLVFDLDPEPGTPLGPVVEAAHELRDRLEDVGMRAWLKTTGGKGLHLVMPFAQPKGGTTTWAEAKAFGLAVCAAMAADSPDRYTLELRKEARGGRILLDYLRNEPARHAIGLLSPRGVEGAPVSMPVRWSQARESLDPRAFTVFNAARLMRAGDPWIGYAERPRTLQEAAERQRRL
jgi:bifunctional non-homologous end joining protein LigD